MNTECAIIICNCNYGQYISRAIRSCLAQTIPVEIVIVDDASTDDSMRWIEPFLNYPMHKSTGAMFAKRELFISDAEFERWRNEQAPDKVFELAPGALQDIIPLPSEGHTIQLIKNPKNVGIAESANIGIRASTSRFFVRLDADDFVHNTFAFHLVEYLKANKDAFCVSCDYWTFDEDNEEKQKRHCAIFEPISCGIMYRRDEFLQHGGYNRKMRHREEEELRKRLGDIYNIDHVHMPLYRYRKHDNNKTLEPGYKETKI